ncbi:MAG: hypothetical protein ACYTKD_29435 [Planctomycetota bacterium]
MFNKRYKAWLEANGGAVEGRRALAEYAEAHGTRAAMRLSGASKVTVNRLRRQERAARAAGAAGGGFRGPGRPPVSADDEERIVDARREHPDYGPRRLKKLCGIPNSESRIWAILKDHGLLKPGHPVKYPDPALMAAIWERRIGYAKLVIEVERQAAMFALRLFAKGKRPDFKVHLGRALRWLEEAERKTEFWATRRDGAARGASACAARPSSRAT